ECDISRPIVNESGEERGITSGREERPFQYSHRLQDARSETYVELKSVEVSNVRNVDVERKVASQGDAAGERLHAHDADAARERRSRAQHAEQNKTQGRFHPTSSHHDPPREPGSKHAQT